MRKKTSEKTSEKKNKLPENEHNCFPKKITCKKITLIVKLIYYLANSASKN